MREADVLSMLGLIEKKVRSQKIDVRHRDILVRLREMLESDLNGHRAGSSAGQHEGGRETAA